MLPQNVRYLPLLKKSSDDIFADNHVNLRSIQYFSADKLTKLPSQHTARILNISERIKVSLITKARRVLRLQRNAQLQYMELVVNKLNNQ